MARRTASKYIAWGFCGALAGTAVGCSARVDVGRAAANTDQDSGPGGSGAAGGGGETNVAGGGTGAGGNGADNAGGAAGSFGGEGAYANGGTAGKVGGQGAYGNAGGTTAIDSGPPPLCDSSTGTNLGDGPTKGKNGYTVWVIASKPYLFQVVGENELSLWVRDASGAPVAGATLTLSLFMPTMGHGSPVAPTVTPLSIGNFDATSVTYNMPGFWTVTADISIGGEQVDSVTMDVCAIDAPVIDSGPPPTCDERTAAMQSQVDAAVSSADTSCSTDDDCVLAVPGTACVGVPCALVPVSQIGKQAIDAVTTEIVAKDCGAFFGAGCQGIGAVSCPAEFPPKCDNGACVLGTAN